MYSKNIFNNNGVPICDVNSFKDISNIYIDASRTYTACATAKPTSNTENKAEGDAIAHQTPAISTAAVSSIQREKEFDRGRE